MQVSKWGNSLAIRLPAKIVDALELKEGDDVQIRIADERTIEIARGKDRDWALSMLNKIRKPLPAGWKFDRNEANGR